MFAGYKAFTLSLSQFYTGPSPPYFLFSVTHQLISRGSQNFKCCWLNLNELSFSRSSWYLVLRARPNDFTDAGINGTICFPAIFISPCKQPERCPGNRVKFKIAFTTYIAAGDFPFTWGETSGIHALTKHPNSRCFIFDSYYHT